MRGAGPPGGSVEPPGGILGCYDIPITARADYGVRITNGWSADELLKLPKTSTRN
jgi:hypothetical protein